MKNLTIRLKFLLVVLVLLTIPFFEETNAQLINLPTNELIDVPVGDIPINEPADNQIVNFSINKKEFTTGEKVEVKTIFHNQTQQSLVGRMIVVILPLDKSFPAKSFIKEFDLLAGEKTQDFISEMNIENWMPAGMYKTEVEIRDARDHIIGKKFEVFEIFKEEINNKIEATIQVCVDKDCSKKRMVFGKDEMVYFKLDTSIQNMKINATIKTPTGKIDILNFKNNASSYSLENAVNGKYSLWINLSKEGYENKRVEKKFSLEEDYTEAEFKSICKIDGKCEGEENIYNCPKDCSPQPINNKLYILIAGILLIAGTGIALVLKRKREKNKKYPY